jgi:CheY-like chemotaxis protein
MAVLGCADMAVDLIDAEHPARAPLQSLRESVMRGRSVVSQLLTFGRRKERDDKAVDLNAVVRATAPLLRQVMGDAVLVSFDLSASGGTILADAGHLQQILLNLASNALHAMPKGGGLTIETRDLESESQAEARVRLIVSDTGSGMDERTRARAFEPFFSTKPQGQGTGLGLSMVYGAVQEANGHIALESERGRGTRVLIDWPVANKPSQPKQPVRRSARAPDTQTVLLAEDEQLVRLSVRHYLEKAGYHVLEAESGEEALALLRAHDKGPELLISDVVLPGLNGSELAQLARERNPDVGVVLMSGHGRDSLLQRGLVAPEMAVLRKPFTPDELFAAIERCSSQRTELGPG